MRILIVDPSGDRKRRACNALAQIKGLTVVGSCSDLTGCFNVVEHQPPNLVLIAPELTVEHGFETMEVLFKCLSVRWFPYQINAGDLGHARASKHSNQPACVNLGESPQSIVDTLSQMMSGRMQVPPSAAAGIFRTTPRMASNKIVMIGSSTGGIDALIRVLGCFPRDCPPTLIVQHTGGTFSEGLARLLDQRVEPTVREAQDGDALTKGTVLIAPGSDSHLELDAKNGMRCRLKAGPKISGHRPSVDALFASGATVAKRITGVILTGMGHDGADGLLGLKQAGAQTIGQNKATSVVYGMPGSAAKIGAVGTSLPLAEIGPAILHSMQVGSR